MIPDLKIILNFKAAVDKKRGFSSAVFCIALMVLLVRPGLSGAATRLWVTDVTPRSFSLVWTTNGPASGSANIYADSEGNQPMEGLTITDASNEHPPAGENGVIKVTISGLNPNTTYYYEYVTTSSEGVLVEPASGELPSVQTEITSVVVNNVTIVHRIVQSDGLTPADGALLLVEVEGGNYPVTGWVGVGVASPMVLAYLDNIYSAVTHQNLQLYGGEDIILTSIGGAIGFRRLIATVPAEIGGIHTLMDPEPCPLVSQDPDIFDDSICTLDTTGPIIDPDQINPVPGAVVNDDWPMISGSYSDEHSEVDPATVRLLVDGFDVTAEATVDTNIIEYTPTIQLSQGNHDATLDVSDQWGYAADPVSWSFTVDINDNPIDISLSASSIGENQPAGSTVGTFSSSDPDTADTHLYSLVAGTGDDDNASFSILGNQLQTASSFDYETQSSYSIRVQTDDQNGGTYEEQFIITVIDANEPPIVSDIPDQSIAEGAGFTTISLDAYVMDLDHTDAELIWSYTGTSELTVSIDAARIATISIPDADWNGSETITFRATDPNALYGEDAANFTVASVNDAPVVGDIPDMTIAVGSSFATINLDEFVSDVDNPDEEITWQASGQSVLSVSIVNRQATIGIPSAAWSGTERITFTAADPGSLTGSDAADFAVNDPGVRYVDVDAFCGAKTPCFSNIQAAINTTPIGETIIYATNQTYSENITLNRANTTVILSGGWDNTFTNVISFTTVFGTLEISDGVIVPENLVIQP